MNEQIVMMMKGLLQIVHAPPSSVIELEFVLMLSLSLDVPLPCPLLSFEPNQQLCSHHAHSPGGPRPNLALSILLL